ncbi:MAG: hypothetical protein IT371_00400 [Deltaproteobacteria bacterium]|nr:hypothetical protein [Deltaproteobacteria bacterium]
MDLAPRPDTGPRGPSDAASDAGRPTGCVTVDDQRPIEVARASTRDEHALTLFARSASRTFWSERGNEAVVLEVSGPRGRIGHLVLHQGADAFGYAMQLGELRDGDAVSVRVSELSAAKALRRACVGPATLTSRAQLGARGEGLVNAPIFKWPVAKRFDDLPVLLGWSKQTAKYEAVYTHENGGTVALCGGGASGIQAELARWGRACDIEGLYAYGGAKSWGRCSGATSFASHAPLMEGAHPIFYYGDGHNRLYEHRGGYGQACGNSSDNKADGDLAGWNVGNPGNDSSLDGPFVVVLRPLPVELDPLGYAATSGTREQLVDRHAPWLYRITDSELRREGRIDHKKALPMERYLFVDVHASDVGGSGDRVCSLRVDGGFVLRVRTAAGATQDGPQMTASYFGAQPNWKRLAIPLDQPYQPRDLTAFVFDAYDDDGIYFLSLGSAFIPKPEGDNGATLAIVRRGVKTVNVYVDDDSSGCVNGQNRDGPEGLAYACQGGAYEVAK